MSMLSIAQSELNPNTSKSIAHYHEKLWSSPFWINVSIFINFHCYANVPLATNAINRVRQPNERRQNHTGLTQFLAITKLSYCYGKLYFRTP